MKTLNNLGVQIVITEHEDVGRNVMVFEEKELRQASIEWIKEIRKPISEGGTIHADCEKQVLVDWIKYFFNITEEDLK